MNDCFVSFSHEQRLQVLKDIYNYIYYISDKDLYEICKLDIVNNCISITPLLQPHSIQIIVELVTYIMCRAWKSDFNEKSHQFFDIFIRSTLSSSLSQLFATVELENFSLLLLPAIILLDDLENISTDILQKLLLCISKHISPIEPVLCSDFSFIPDYPYIETIGKHLSMSISLLVIYLCIQYIFSSLNFFIIFLLLIQ